MSGLNNPLSVAKTIKLFINGQFPRTESGRSFPLYIHGKEEIYANVCQASRKDCRNAVEAAKKAQSSWAHKTAYNRAQILYRMAEMMQSRYAEIQDLLELTLGLKTKDAQLAVQEAIDALVYFAGFADKYQSLIGTINPVSGPHHNFTTPEAVGVVALLSEDNKFDFAQWTAQIAAIVCSGNTLVALVPQSASAVIAPISEIFATSDLPSGVINLLSGFFKELFPHFTTHMELQAVSFQRSNNEELTQLQKASCETMKRVIPKVKDVRSLEHLISFVEHKTVWHPSGF